MSRRVRGFTLIELLVVIAIIAILAAILFPVFVSAKQKAQLTTCSSNTHSICVAMFLYMDDNGGRWPLWRIKVPPYATIRGKSPVSLDERCWRDGLWNYLRNCRVMVCPCRQFENGIVTSATSNIPAWQAADAHIGLLVESYGFNYVLNHQFPEITTVQDDAKAISGNLSEVSYPSRTMLLTEQGRRGYPEICDLADPYGFGGRPKGWSKTDNWVDWNPYDPYALELHGNGACAAYCDGHVKYFHFMDWVKLGEPLLNGYIYNQSAVRQTPDYAAAWIMGGYYVMVKDNPTVANRQPGR